MPETALIAGATGLIGAHVLELLVADVSRYKRVIALTRRPLPTHPKLETRVTDFESLPAADLAASHVFCTLGTTIRKAGSQPAFRRVDHDYVIALARRSFECGARTFLLVSSVGANPASGNFYLRVKGETEAAVSSVPFDAVHIFRPSVLVGARAEHRSGERAGILAARAFEWALVGGLRRYRAIAAHAVARAMMAAAASPVTGIHTYEYDAIQTLAAI